MVYQWYSSVNCFPRFQRESNIFQGGPTFCGVGGGPMLISIETHTFSKG